MLFNSYIFVFAFLPLTFLAFLAVMRLGAPGRALVFTLGLASLVFYGFAGVNFLLLFLASLAVNVFVVWRIQSEEGRRRWFLAAFGVVANLGYIGFFKYYDFFVQSVFDPGGAASFELVTAALPIGISFYTFQQIAYICDAYKGRTGPYDPFRHVLFISFFPQLIAGPIVHHREMMPQFAALDRTRISENLAIGLSIFAVGLFKKVIIADGVAPFSDAAFDAAAAGEAVGFLAAWTGTFAYSFQLYFDFSGYSDMAVGLARMFGIVLPLNFYSPYKSANIIEFWRRWHITLSRFLRDYLYFPLGGNRKGSARRYTNLMLVMLIGGLWHGAGWTFVLWGGLHGAMLMINHAWRRICEIGGMTERVADCRLRPFWIMLTFVAVSMAWVPFRAPNLDATWLIYQALLGSGDVWMSLVATKQEFARWFAAFFHVVDVAAIDFATIYSDVETAFGGVWRNAVLYLAFALAFFFPNTAQLFRRHGPVLEMPRIADDDAFWRPRVVWATAIALMFVASVLNFTAVSPFLYFQF